MIERLWHFGYKTVSKNDYRLLVITLIYYVSLYFSTSNRTTLLFTAGYWLAVFLLTKSLYLSVFLVFLATLPFPKGKAQQFLLLPRDLIERYALYSVTYFFPIYISDFFLTLFGYLYVRKKIFAPAQQNKVSRTRIQIFVIFSLFIIWVLIGGVTSIFPEVGLLSSVQLLRMFIIFTIPFLFATKEFKEHHLDIFSVIIALLIFESGWTIMQRFHGGPLGKDLEVYLPGSQYGIFSSEDSSLLRNTGTFFEPSILGTFLLMQIGALLPFLFAKPNVSLKMPSLIAVTLGSVALVFTGSRALYGIWFLLVVFTGLLWRSVNPGWLKQVREKYSLKIGIGTLGLLIVTLPYIFQRARSVTDVFTTYGSASYRIQMIMYSIRIGVENLIRGVGINLSPYYLSTGFAGERYVFDPTYPHNLFAQLFAETGLVGSSLFLLFLVCLFRYVITNFQIKRYYGFGVAAALYVLCAQFYPIFLNHTELSSFFFLYAGFAVFWSQSRRYD